MVIPSGLFARRRNCGRISNLRQNPGEHAWSQIVAESFLCAGPSSKPTVLQEFESPRTGREQSVGCSFGAEFVLYNGLGTGAFSLLTHLVMGILKPLGFFTNV